MYTELEPSKKPTLERLRKVICLITQQEIHSLRGTRGEVKGSRGEVSVVKRPKTVSPSFSERFSRNAPASENAS